MDYLIGFYGPEPWEAPACNGHLTAEEKAQGERAVALAQAMLDAQEPACWAWPVPRGITYATEDEATDILRDWQNGRCALCGYSHKRLDEDHDYATGLTRGLLCHPCNITEGHNARPAGKFHKYRQRHPTLILGLHIRYYSPLKSYPDWLARYGPAAS